MGDSVPRDVGRPSKAAPYAPQVTRWLDEDPGLSSAEILRRARLAGYRGGKSALYDFVRRLRVPGAGYRRCTRCRALLRDLAEVCRHCGVRLSPTWALAPDVPGRQTPEARAPRHAPTAPAVERYLLIAARERQDLYEYFKQKFGSTAAIEVVRERRVADRRKRATTPPLDGRRRERRARPALDVELKAFGFAIVTRD
jgi:hypothetical protein